MPSLNECKVNLYIVGILHSYSACTWQVMGIRYWPKQLQGPISLQRMTLLGYKIHYKLSYTQQGKVKNTNITKVIIWALFTFKIFQKRMSEKCHNSNNSGNTLTCRRTDGGLKQIPTEKKIFIVFISLLIK